MFPRTKTEHVRHYVCFLSPPGSHFSLLGEKQRLLSSRSSAIRKIHPPYGELPGLEEKGGLLLSCALEKMPKIASCMRGIDKKWYTVHKIAHKFATGCSSHSRHGFPHCCIALLLSTFANWYAQFSFFIGRCFHHCWKKQQGNTFLVAPRRQTGFPTRSEDNLRTLTLATVALVCPWRFQNTSILLYPPTAPNR